MSDFEVIQDNMGVWHQTFEAAISRALEQIGLTAEGQAKVYCPVDTGTLRNSITHIVQPAEKAVYIGTNVEYARYVEEGTSNPNYPKQPFLRPAAAKHGAEFNQIIKKEMGA